MIKNTEYKGIDEREIKCSCKSDTCISGGISFDSEDNNPLLRFHFLDVIKTGKTYFLEQKTKSMILSKDNTNQLIKELKKIQKQCK